MTYHSAVWKRFGGSRCLGEEGGIQDPQVPGAGGYMSSGATMRIAPAVTGRTYFEPPKVKV